jgi:hypothetical protein
MGNQNEWDPSIHSAILDAEKTDKIYNTNNVISKNINSNITSKWKDPNRKIKEPREFKDTHDIYEQEDDNRKYSTYTGKIVDLSKNGCVGIRLDANEKRLDYPLGLTIYIDRRSILQVYPSKIVQYLTPRLALKHLWKDFIFREVKTTKCGNIKYAEYKYISKCGFERIKRFPTLEKAKSSIDFEYHKNIAVYYEDFFGFTTDKSLQYNDAYSDQEIFFSKKCYCELDWSKNPTGDFLVNEKGFNEVAPLTDAWICGTVENGEKGLFYRKWFVCSKEFFTLWTMVCDPNDDSLYEYKKNGDFIEKKKIKDFPTLLKELDTSHYSVDLKTDLKERRKNHLIHNLERAAMYYPNRYKQVAEVLFSNGFLKQEESSLSYSDDFSQEHTPFQKKLVRNILWSKRVE